MTKEIPENMNLKPLEVKALSLITKGGSYVGLPWGKKISWA